jgi:[ribosomal protein S5]-alanine N-acetyltransferase
VRPAFEIVTDRLRLVLPHPGDAAVVLRYFADNRGHLERWAPPAPEDFYSIGFWERRLARSIEEYAEDRSLRLFLTPRLEPGPIIGSASYTEIVRGGFQACYLGYGLAAAEEGRGLMTEALKASLEWVFEELSMHRVMANYMPNNERSGALLRRLGFVPEGYARDYLFIDGAWRDHVLTALTNPRWRPRSSGARSR